MFISQCPVDFYYSITENKKGRTSISFDSLYLKLLALHCKHLDSYLLSIRELMIALCGMILLPQ